MDCASACRAATLAVVVLIDLDYIGVVLVGRVVYLLSGWIICILRDPYKMVDSWGKGSWEEHPGSGGGQVGLCDGSLRERSRPGAGLVCVWYSRARSRKRRSRAGPPWVW